MDAAHLALAVLKLNVRKTKVKKMLENMDKYTKNCG
ncbi:unknown [Firmicutes bacterium CAG:646]|nr:unknown [Firmicutes bacterium CAG:646]